MKVDFRPPVFLMFTLGGLFGCSPKKAEINATEQRLLKIGTAYVSAANRMGQPPQSFDDLKPELGDDVSPDLMRSPRDGEDFVIIWGVDYNKVPPAAGHPYMVGGYEKRGLDGKRYVLRFPMGVVMKTDKEFRELRFPPGHTPPG